MNSPLHDVSSYFPPAPSTNLTVLLKRDDLIHPIVSGNKWRKLLGLSHQLPEGTKVFTMGGPWSNHGHASAYVAKLYRWHLTLLVRGEQTRTDTLDDCRQWGAKIVPVTRQTYRRLRRTITLGDGFWLPEGGSGPWNRTGLAMLAKELPKTDWLAIAVGSGGTLRHLLPYISPHIRVLAVCVGMPAENYRKQFLIPDNKVIWHDPVDSSRFGQISDKTASTLDRLWSEHRLLLDPVYTAKLWTTIEHLISQGFFGANKTITMLHTGGLQGLRGYAKQYPHWQGRFQKWQKLSFPTTGDDTLFPPKP